MKNFILFGTVILSLSSRAHADQRVNCSFRLVGASQAENRQTKLIAQSYEQIGGKEVLILQTQGLEAPFFVGVVDIDKSQGSEILLHARSKDGTLWIGGRLNEQYAAHLSMRYSNGYQPPVLNGTCH